MSDSVLVVDGDEVSRNTLKDVLLEIGFDCWCTGGVEDARLRLEESRPALVILDWNQDGIPSLEFLAYIRKRVAMMAIPVIMISDRHREDEKIAALESGADDFLDKPYSIGELKARIQALLRRTDNGRLKGDVLEVVGLRLELSNQVVYAGPAFTPLKIGRMAFQLLFFLAANLERVYSRAELLHHVWGEDRGTSERTVDVHIRYLRRDLAATGHAKYLQTVRGYGYRFSLHVKE